LHNKNIIHRDIKAENVVVHDKVVKICDFGWASEGEYSRKSLCGTPAYISPEVVQNKLYDKKIDIWSTGVLTFELIFGRIPFDIRAQEDLRKIVEEELKFPYER
jgi:serine/threonine protein kinase